MLLTARRHGVCYPPAVLAIVVILAALTCLVVFDTAGVDGAD